jgi:hypothetical protein
MNLLIGDEVELIIDSIHGTTTVRGVLTALGLHNTKPDVSWFQIAGLTSTFWSDEVTEVNKVG